MLTLRFEFTAGRFHGTPWGSHVNEGQVEWPPSPWRVLRALIAVGFARAGWTTVPAAASALLMKLSGTLPTMHLPPASAAHTRHYMPPYSGNTSRVFDTFAYVGEGPLVMTWDIALEEGELRLLDELVGAMPYLGRAESWVDVRRIADVPAGLEVCVAGESCPGPGLERIPLLAPEPAADYATWRAAAAAREIQRILGELGAKAREKGTAPPKKLGKKDTARVETLFPPTVVDALQVETRTLQSQGWSQPPGSRWVSYWRAADALRASPKPAVSVRRAPKPTAALLALSSDTKNGQLLPPFHDALWRLETIHDALVKRSDRQDGRGPSPSLSGKENGVPLQGHRHATLIPLTLDARHGRLDHVLVFAPMGFDDAARSALTGLSKTWAKNLPTIFVTVAGLGGRDQFATLVPALREGRVWETSTPFVPPRHPKERGKDSLEGQIQVELEQRGFPRAERVELLPEQRLEFRKFRRARRDPNRAPPVSFCTGVRLVFAEPVRGPITIGYASHFGLGCFTPIGGS